LGATSTTDRPSVKPAPRFTFVGGKGGVGKTTCAAAIAVSAAAAGRRTLVLSTDPAPSVGDALGVKLAAVPRRVPLRRGSLHAAELDAARALERWLSRHRAALERIALRGTWLDKDDVARLLRLSLPGIDEMAALFEIARFGRTTHFDLIVVDTAPTGHTLRMLTMPETLQAIAEVFDRMQAKHRALVDALGGGWQPDADDAIIQEIDRDGREWAARLRDPEAVRMHWVTLPEPMAVEETKDAMAALEASGMPVHALVVNRVTPPPREPCGWCATRRVLERRAMVSLRAHAGSVPIAVIQARDTEPRGARVLAALGSELGSQHGLRLGAEPRVTNAWRQDVPPAREPVIGRLVDADTRLVLFGGKGGVGKTTCAAAAALVLAARTSSSRVLLLSTDPAHSLGDVLGIVVSDVARTVPRAPANLNVRELDAASRFRRVRDRYAEMVDAVFDRLSRGSSSRVGIDQGHDRAVMRSLIDLAPPGIDELAAVIEVTDALDDGRYDLIVMDTAPSGHALRLLEMPALVQDWAKALMAILLKYQPIIGLGDLGAVLLGLSQGLGRLRALLTDPKRTRFVAVTRAAALPRAETSRLMARLDRMGIHVPAVVVNAVGRGTCTRCRRAAAAERREIAALRRIVTAAAAEIVMAPVELPPPHGSASLRRWARTWHPPAPSRLPPARAARQRTGRRDTPAAAVKAKGKRQKAKPTLSSP
jgi:arsenite/tail-anchored protein-transporting ATPase